MTPECMLEGEHNHVQVSGLYDHGDEHVSTKIEKTGHMREEASPSSLGDTESEVSTDKIIRRNDIASW